MSPVITTQFQRCSGAFSVFLLPHRTKTLTTGTGVKKSKIVDQKKYLSYFVVLMKFEKLYFTDERGCWYSAVSSDPSSIIFIKTHGRRWAFSVHPHWPPHIQNTEGWWYNKWDGVYCYEWIIVLLTFTS